MPLQFESGHRLFIVAPVYCVWFLKDQLTRNNGFLKSLADDSLHTPVKVPPLTPEDKLLAISV